MSNISNEMFAAYIDGNCNPLEETIIKSSILDEFVAEILELFDDCKDLENVNDFEPLDLSDIVHNFTKPLRDYNELKGNIDEPENSTII